MSKASYFNKKSLGIFSITMMNVIAVDSLRTLPFSATFGSSLIFYYVIAALTFFLPAAYITAELATGWPNKGGIYVWVKEAFGELGGLIIIWLQWIYNIVWYPTILTFIGNTLAYLINPALGENKIFIFFSVLFIFWGATIVNCFSLKVSSWISTIGAILGTLIPMIIIISLSLFWISTGKTIQIDFTKASLLPNLNSIDHLSFLLAILFGLIGIEVSATHADEVINPGRTFPRAILLSAIIILSSLVLSSLAIAIIVPQNDLNILSGLMHAFELFFEAYHLSWMIPIIAILIIIGGIGGISTWIISPTKGLLVASMDGSLPAFFSKTNRHGSPIVILAVQAIICTLLCSVFLFMPSVNSAYWILTAITGQLAMLVYIALFASAFYLRIKKPNIKRAYRIPFGNVGIGILCFLGLLSSFIAIILGFLPPEKINIGNMLIYEIILIIGIIVFCLPPIIIYKLYKTNIKKY